MSILIQLGANATAFIQFALFIFTISFLTIYVYGPYFKALDKRLERTKGGEELASDAAKKAAEVKLQYEIQARELAAKIRATFEQEKTIGIQHADKLMNSAREGAAVKVEENRKQLAMTVAHVASELSKETQQISNSIKTKLIGY